MPLAERFRIPSNQDKICIFVDAANSHAAAELAHFQIDWKRVLAFFNHQGRVRVANYYSASLPEGSFQPVRPLLDWLSNNGWVVKSKEAKAYDNKIKGNMDVDVAVDAMQQAFQRNMDHMILFSGDGDFCPLVEAVQAMGVYVTVISQEYAGGRNVIARELRRQANRYINLTDLQGEIIREREGRENVERRLPRPGR